MINYFASDSAHSIRKQLFLFYPLIRYFKDFLLAAFTIVISINSYTQPNIQSEKKFQLTGTLLDRDTGQIVLWYPNMSGKYVRDTAYIKHGRFRFEGYILEPSFAHLIGSSAKGNYADFFIEEGNQAILLRENHFDKLQMTGSKSQLLYDSLNVELGEVKAQIATLDSIETILDSVIKYCTEGGLKKMKQPRLTELIAQRNKLVDSSKAITINFIKQHPDSYVSVTVLSGLLIVSRYPVHTAKSLYELLDAKLKSCRAGIYCLDEIEKRAKLTSGNMLSSFQVNNIKGKVITLEQFKNKYVLLDFWASWCLPCRKEIPALKMAYAKYRLKGLEVIAISSDNDGKSWKKAIRKDRTESWVHVLKNKEMASIFEPIQVIPQKILLDKAGKIIWSSLDDNTNDWQDVLLGHLNTNSN